MFWYAENGYIFCIIHSYTIYLKGDDCIGQANAKEFQCR